jgi:hypothetical protein
MGAPDIVANTPTLDPSPQGEGVDWTIASSLAN